MCPGVGWGPSGTQVFLAVDTPPSKGGNQALPAPGARRLESSVLVMTMTRQEVTSVPASGRDTDLPPHGMWLLQATGRRGAGEGGTEWAVGTPWRHPRDSDPSAVCSPGLGMSAWIPDAPRWPLAPSITPTQHIVGENCRLCSDSLVGSPKSPAAPRSPASDRRPQAPVPGLRGCSSLGDCLRGKKVARANRSCQ